MSTENQTVLISLKSPMVDTIYDFRISINMKIQTVIQQMLNCLEQQGLNPAVNKNQENMLLCTATHVLPKEKTIRQCGIQSGDVLVLV
jgi:uncharacterized ubiquitin-like protein YukD